MMITGKKNIFNLYTIKYYYGNKKKDKIFVYDDKW